MTTTPNAGHDMVPLPVSLEFTDEIQHTWRATVRVPAALAAAPDPERLADWLNQNDSWHEDFDPDHADNSERSTMSPYVNAVQVIEPAGVPPQPTAADTLRQALASAAYAALHRLREELPDLLMVGCDIPEDGAGDWSVTMGWDGTAISGTISLLGIDRLVIETDPAHEDLTETLAADLDAAHDVFTFHGGNQGITTHHLTIPEALEVLRVIAQANASH